ncbi:MAG: C2H2-type zinc finger protein, partial [Cyclobacteriaceae bacterium]
AMKAGIKVAILPFRCPECGRCFQTNKELNGHISGHKMKKEWEEKKYPAYKQDIIKDLQVLKELGLLDALR